ncbi:MAG: DEAD/DEAH box helicase [Methylococcaceae bacterium]|nr:DEAD/DEAH box helicase [Methylococcaceae bacterium]
MLFSQLGLSPSLLKAVAEQGYETPTPIQQQAIPAILEGHDIRAAAQTGTGKTAGFSLPILEILSKQVSSQKPRPIKALILTPTRELAMQVYESFKTYGKNTHLISEQIFGGVNINSQIKRLHRGADIVVATPGRLLDLAQQRKINLSQVEYLVLDEADRMLDMGFIRDIRKIISLLPKKRQNLLFSATFSNEIKTLSKQLLNNPVEVEVARSNSTVESIDQLVYGIKRENKRELLAYLIGNGHWKQVLIFVRTKHGAERLGKQLKHDGIRCATLHGNKSQSARVKALSDFKNGSITALIATDIAARGIDIDHLPHVVNYDLPMVAEDYVHRIGRTGRAGKEGVAISLVCEDEIKLLVGIEKLLKQEIPRVKDTGYTPISLAASNSPKKAKSQRNSRSNQSGQRNNTQGDKHTSSSNRKSRRSKTNI